MMGLKFFVMQWNHFEGVYKIIAGFPTRYDAEKFMSSFDVGFERNLELLEVS